MLTAKVRSRCGACGEAIELGQPIRAGYSTWIHGDCENPSGRRPAEVCSVCFLEKPCAC